MSQLLPLSSTDADVSRVNKQALLDSLERVRTICGFCLNNAAKSGDARLLSVYRELLSMTTGTHDEVLKMKESDICERLDLVQLSSLSARCRP